MRRVQFDLVNEEFPDSREAFKNTGYYQSLGKYVGWYSGSDDSIEDYTGPWPVIAIEKSLPTLPWLREDLGEAGEFAARAYAAVSTNQYSTDVGVFLDAIRDRMNDVIIVTDSQYEAGINLLYQVGIIDEDKAIYLLSLGDHTLPST